MANKSLGRFVMEWAGDYNPATTYKYLQVTFLNGSSYLCIAPCTGKDPETETGYWALMASKGDQGNQDIVDAAEAHRDAASGFADNASSSASAAAASALQLASGAGSPVGPPYATLAALNVADPDHGYNYLILDNGHWCYYDTGTSAFVDSGYVWQAASVAEMIEILSGLQLNVNLLSDADITAAHNKVLAASEYYIVGQDTSPVVGSTRYFSIERYASGSLSVQLYAVFFDVNNAEISRVTKISAVQGLHSIQFEAPVGCTKIVFSIREKTTATSATLKYPYYGESVSWRKIITNEEDAFPYMEELIKAHVLNGTILPAETIFYFANLTLTPLQDVHIYQDLSPAAGSTKYAHLMQSGVACDVRLYARYFDALGAQIDVLCRNDLEGAGQNLLTMDIPENCASLYIRVKNYNTTNNVTISRPYYGSSQLFDGFEVLNAHIDDLIAAMPSTGGETVLYGKSVILTGDSISKGANNAGVGYMEKIATRNAMTLDNFATSGGTFVLTPKEGGYRFDITASVDTFIAANPTSDYVIVSGGYNDSQTSILNPLGTTDLTDFAGTYDTDTVLGCIDSICYKLVNQYPTSKYGFVLTYKIHDGWDTYRNAIITVLEKWAVPYCDLGKNSHLLCKVGVGTRAAIFTDGTHPNDTGYEMIADIVEAWMKTL